MKTLLACLGVGVISYFAGCILMVGYIAYDADKNGGESPIIKGILNSGKKEEKSESSFTVKGFTNDQIEA